MSDDRFTAHRQVIQAIRVRLATKIQPQITILHVEVQIFETFINKIGKAYILETSTLTEDDLASTIDIMCRASRRLREFIQEFRQDIDATLRKSPQTASDLDTILMRSLTVCHDVRTFYHSVSGAAELLLEPWVKENDIKQKPDDFREKLKNIIEICKSAYQYLDEGCDFLYKEFPRDNQ